MKHANVAIFVPNNGCPHMCSFCDQFKITGTSKQPTRDDVIKIIDSSIESFRRRDIPCKEIAFFGGSFTAIKKQYMKELLSIAYTYVNSGQFEGIRISTRPDCLDDCILKLLKSYGVKSIELGAQSMDDEVLLANNRGHCAKDVIYACEIIRSYGFELGLQMMTNLHMSNNFKDIHTAKEFVKLKPDTVRIYPTITMKGTLLEKLYYEGKYVPMSLNESVLLCANLIGLFDVSKIRVIKLGLHSSDSINENFVAGPLCPSFRELCEGRNLRLKCVKAVTDMGIKGKKISVFVNPRDVSKIIGRHRSGIAELNKICPEIRVLTEEKINLGSLKVEEWKSL